MKTIKKILLVLITGILLIGLGLYVFGYGYILKGVRITYLKGHATAYLEDYESFDNTVVKAAAEEHPWPLHPGYNRAEPTEKLAKTHEKLGTIAFMIIKNDSIWYEQYYNGFDENSRTNSFSMAKSMVSGLLGKAIMEGYIEGLDQPVGDFLPEFSEGLAAEVTVGDLVRMSSGLDWDETYYSPFSITTKAYFYHDLRKVMRELPIVEEPGREFNYLSGNTLLLAMVLEEATGKKMADYFSEAFWQPLGAKNDALWQLDSEDKGLVKAYCCFASNARDFARFGKLYKDHGRWNGRQILDSVFTVQSVTPRFEDDPVYGYGFWLLEYKDKNFFMMRGHLGQYVIVAPEDDLIIVRLGHKKSFTVRDKHFTTDIYTYIDEVYEMVGSNQNPEFKTQNPETTETIETQNIEPET